MTSPPMTPTEERIAQIFAELLGLEFADVDDDVFSLGGDSMDAVRIQLQIEREFDVKLPVEEFEEAESIRAIAAWVDEAKQSAAP